MASRFGITANDVRLIVGLGTTDISDADTTTFISWAEYEAENDLKTRFGRNNERERITKWDSSNVARLTHTPINQIVEVQIGGTSIDTRHVKFDRTSGRIILTGDAVKNQWDGTSDKDNFVKYNYGKLETTSTETTLQLVGTAAQTTLIASGADFLIGDYVMVVGTGTGNTDGFSEILAVTGTSDSTITVTKKQYKHNVGADVIKMEVPNVAKQLAMTIAGLGIAARQIGKTFKFATSYSIPELSITKGVPYPHFERLSQNLLKRRDMLLKQFRKELAIA